MADIKYHGGANNKCACIMRFVCFQKCCAMFLVLFATLAGCFTHCICEKAIFLISNFRRVLNVCFLLGYSPVSEFCVATFRNTLSVPSS